jgi:hypothetical protein
LYNMLYCIIVDFTLQLPLKNVLTYISRCDINIYIESRYNEMQCIELHYIEADS